MTIDINTYFGQWPFWPLIDAGEDDLLRAMDQHGIELAYPSSLKAVFTDTAAGNAEIMRLCRRHPDRLRPALSIKPYSDEDGDWLRYLQEQPKAIVKLHPLHHNYDLEEEPWIDEALAICAARKLPVLVPIRLMMSWRLPVLDLRKIRNLALKHTATRFVIGAVNYGGELQTARAILRQCPNVWLETSAMMAYRSIEMLVEEHGAHRLMHGSGMVLQNAAIGPMRIRTAEIDSEAQATILAGNAKAIMGAGT